MKKASCSFVIPTLGRNLKLLERSILSIVNCHNHSPEVEIKVVLNDKNKCKLENLVADQSVNPNITVFTMDKNLGFAAATNAGIVACDSDYIVTLNDDAWVEPNFLTEMIKSQQETGADMVASTIYRGDTQEIDSCGFDFAWRGKAVAMRPAEQQIEREDMVDNGFEIADPHLLRGRQVRSHDRQVRNDNTLLLTSTLDKTPDNWRQNLDLLPNIDKKQQQAHFDHQLPFGPDAAAALYTRKMLDQIGLFNESYFAYLEDVDLALRARLVGFSCAWASKAIVHHEKHATSAKMGKFKQKQDVKNWWRMVMGSYPKEAWGRFGGQILLERARNCKGLIFSD